MHKFEAAGLGKAPFRFVGYSREVFQAVPGDPSCPLQPGACCDYCSTGIYDVFHVVSSDGQRFKVGCDCILKVGDAGLKKVVDEHKAKARREASKRKAISVQSALVTLIAAKREALASMPHPKGFKDQHTGAPLTALDFAEYMLKCCGASGKARLLKQLTALVQEAA